MNFVYIFACANWIILNQISYSRHSILHHLYFVSMSSIIYLYPWRRCHDPVDHNQDLAKPPVSHPLSSYCGGPGAQHWHIGMFMVGKCIHNSELHQSPVLQYMVFLNVSNIPDG